MNLDRVEVDGSMLEGGGQILRTSIALSAITGKPLRVFQIRAKRSPPGLRMQHLTAIKAVALMVDAETEGLKVGSSEIMFTPKQIRGGTFSFDVGSAGSTTLVLQALLPVAAYSPKPVSIEIQGGTNNPFAPTVEYMQNVLFIALKKMKVECSASLVRRGFYPKGGGIVKAQLNPIVNIRPLYLVDQVKPIRIWGLSYSCRLPAHITRRMAESARISLEKAGYGNVDIELQSLQAGDDLCSADTGCGIILFADLEGGISMGADSLGEIGKPAEMVGEEAALRLIDQLRSRMSIDPHLADQLIVWVSLAEGTSKLKACKLTLHTLTSIELCRLIVGSGFHVEGELGENATVECEGICLKNRFI